MLEPSEIDLLRQDLEAALTLLGQDQIDDAHALMTGHGFRAKDVEITQGAEPAPPYHSVISGTVTPGNTRHVGTRGAGRWLMRLLRA